MVSFDLSALLGAVGRLFLDELDLAGVLLIAYWEIVHSYAVLLLVLLALNDLREDLVSFLHLLVLLFIMPALVLQAIGPLLSIRSNHFYRGLLIVDLHSLHHLRRLISLGFQILEAFVDGVCLKDK